MQEGKHGIFMLTMPAEEARALKDDLALVAFQLGPAARRLYQGLCDGFEKVDEGQEGVVFDSGPRDA